MRLLFTLVLSGLAWASFAQGSHQAKDTSVQDILDCIDWLQNTPIEEDREVRKTANAFLLQWISQSPSVHVELHTDIVNLAGKNPDLLVIYITGWAEYALVTKNEYPTIEAHIEGMKAVVEFYRNNKGGLERDKKIEKLMKLESKGTMEDKLRKDWQ